MWKCKIPRFVVFFSLLWDALHDLVLFVLFKNVKNAHGGVILLVKLQVFSCQYCEMFRNTIFDRPLPVAASETGFYKWFLFSFQETLSSYKTLVLTFKRYVKYLQKILPYRVIKWVNIKINECILLGCFSTGLNFKACVNYFCYIFTERKPLKKSMENVFFQLKLLFSLSRYVNLCNCPLVYRFKVLRGSWKWNYYDVMNDSHKLSIVMRETQKPLWIKRSKLSRWWITKKENF